MLTWVPMFTAVISRLARSSTDAAPRIDVTVPPFRTAWPRRASPAASLKVSMIAATPSA